MTPRSDRKRLPRYVQAFRQGFRGWWMEAGVRRYTRVFDTPEEAHQLASRKREDLKQPRGRLTLGGAVELVRADLRFTGATEGTVRWYEHQFKVFDNHWDARSRLGEFNVAEVEWFIEKRLAAGVSPNTVLHHLRALGRIFNVAIRAGRLSDNPVTRARKPKAIPSRPHLFPWAEAAVLPERIAEFSEEDADLVSLVLHTGLRRAEVSRLRVEDTVQGLLVEGKTGQRHIPVPPQLEELLARMRGRAEAAFLLPGAVERNRLECVIRVFKRWQAKLRVPKLHPHALRHTFASRLAELGVPRYVLADLLGHGRKTTSITDRYITAFGKETSKAMELIWTGETW
ncbi:MAG: site-specific integrase [Planctomycetota bacterium]